jgi:hypothetical protein
MILFCFATRLASGGWVQLKNKCKVQMSYSMVRSNVDIYDTAMLVASRTTFSVRGTSLAHDIRCETRNYFELHPERCRYIKLHASTGRLLLIHSTLESSFALLPGNGNVQALQWRATTFDAPSTLPCRATLHALVAAHPAEYIDCSIFLNGNLYVFYVVLSLIVLCDF